MHPRPITARVRSWLIAVVSATTISVAEAQDRRLLVVDSAGTPVPFALVTLSGGARRVASDSGIAILGRVAHNDSVKLLVRRVGYAPFDGWVRTAADPLVVRLTPLARQLSAVTVTERANTPLARTGFYDRLERARRGAYSARFITPEELDLRSPGRVSDVLAGEAFLRIRRQSRRPILTGRGPGCPVAILVDGNRVTNTVEDYYTHEGQRVIKEMGGSQRDIEEFLRARQTIDEIVSALSVAAIEIYASVNSAPADLQRSLSAEACGIVAIWTGSRQ